MLPSLFNKQSIKGASPVRLLFSIGLPLLLMLTFFGQYWLNIDFIGWSSGFSHPLTGWDHLLTMLAVGIWAAQLRGQAIWMLPLAFVGVMSLGGLAGASGFAIPSVDGVILVSCAVFSILITRKIRFSSKINVLIVAFFAFFHGFAHGQEISTSASLISYTLGFMLATLLLHGAGILVAKLVVLAATCLLTALFSNAALAKTAESFPDVTHKNTVFTHQQHDGGKPQFRIASDSWHEAGGQLGITAQDSGDIAASAFNLQAGDQDIGGAAYHAPHLNNASSQQAFDNRSYKPLSAPEDVADPVCLDFKHYFPDINHTPGQDLLSNGVGLTSPPVLFASTSTPRISARLRNNPVSLIEALPLQLIFADFASGDSNSKSITASGHYFPIDNADKATALQPVAHHFKANSTTDHPRYLTFSAISGFQFLSPSFSNLPLKPPRYGGSKLSP